MSRTPAANTTHGNPADSKTSEHKLRNTSDKDVTRYFAYGSNLNEEDWRAWCKGERANPDSLKSAVPAFLPDHDVRFSRFSTTRHGGVLDVCRRLGQIVPGVLFEVEPPGLETLDRKEGRPKAYRQKEVDVILTDGSTKKAVTYVVVKPEPFVQPTKDYVDLVSAGLKHHNLSTEHLDAAANNEQTPFLVNTFFFYGTLMHGEERHHIVRQHEPTLTRPATVRGRLVDVGSYPGLVLDRDGTVHGERVTVNRCACLLTKLDEIEGFRGFEAEHNLFRRTLITVDADNVHPSRPSWTYTIQDPSKCQDIASGCWRTHRRTTRP
jgi:gamma-glutamylcyclotransferase (GGCT)/AIG2-like uncharacterized protein YtfP